MNIREIVLDMLLENERENTYIHLLVREVLDKYNYLDARDKAFIKKLTEGVTERKPELDDDINRFSKIKTDKMKPVIRNILRMGVYQILYMEQIPDSAACNEAVKLAERRKFYNLKGFVNGILRNIARNKNNLSHRELWLKYSMPEWITDKFLTAYGEEKTEKILAAFLEEKPVTVRKKESLSEEEWLLIEKEMKDKGVKVLQHSYLPYAYELKKTEGLQNIQAFLNGDITVQDVSSMLAVQCSGVKKGDVVLDLCAAPGGKSMHFAEKLRDGGKVYSFDVSEMKTAYIEANRQRMGYDNIEVKIQDATVFCEEYEEMADVVLADVPCSGLGVMGKKCDIKYRLSEEEIENIAKLQRRIMENAWRYVKKGGTLIYSTCTISKAENEDMVKWLTENTPLKLSCIDTYLPKELICETTKKGYLQLLPGIHRCDGFFIARLKRED